MLDLPTSTGRSLAEYAPATKAVSLVSVSTPPVLDVDLTAGLRRLKLAAMRQLALELLVTAKTQRWSPEEVLRALVEAEITARDASNERARLKAATFPVLKTIEDFDLAASSIPAPTWAYLTSLEWIRAKENVALIGPAGTGKSHTLIALGHAAVLAGHRVRYLTAADLVETLYRGLADNTVGKVIEVLLRNDVLLVDEIGFAPLDDTGAQLLFRFVAATYERRSLGIASHHSFEDWGRFLPEHTTAVSMLDRLLHHATTVVTNGQSYRMRQARQRRGGELHPVINPAEGGDFHLAKTGDFGVAVDIRLSRIQVIEVGRRRIGHIRDVVATHHGGRRTECQLKTARVLRVICPGRGCPTDVSELSTCGHH